MQVVLVIHHLMVVAVVEEPQELVNLLHLQFPIHLEVVEV